MGFFRSVQAVDNNRLFGFCHQFSQPMGRVFFHETQAFGKPDAVAPEKPDNQQAVDIFILEQDFRAIRKYGGVRVRAAGNVNGIANGGGLGKDFGQVLSGGSPPVPARQWTNP